MIISDLAFIISILVFGVIVLTVLRISFDMLSSDFSIALWLVFLVGSVFFVISSSVLFFNKSDNDLRLVDSKHVPAKKVIGKNFYNVSLGESNVAFNLKEGLLYQDVKGDTIVELVGTNIADSVPQNVHVYYFDNIFFKNIKRSSHKILISLYPIEKYEIKSFYIEAKKAKTEETK